ncbi:hypothetical protein FDECE_16266 [Fusarium decemcellulare]|nr:hypothetical protein FDECE_16266 [Fusarium decemcellulare]
MSGCGKGYDVAMLALHGFDAYGIEVSETGVKVAKSYVAAELAEPQPFNFSASDTLPGDRTATANIVRGDFFTKEWEVECGNEKFDLIYDYTFLCALLPEMRKPWAKRMQELLAPNGVLVCLEFPLYKALEAPGPPWGLKGIYWDLLVEGGNGIVKEAEIRRSEVGSGPFKRIEYFKPPRSHEFDKGTDMMSIWTWRQPEKVGKGQAL